jgi:hypothetical protein
MTPTTILPAFLVALVCSGAQSTPLKQVVGAVSAHKAESAEVAVRSDSGEVVTLKISGASIAQRIAPGEKDPRNSPAVAVGEIALGDRVLVTLAAGWRPAVSLS